VRTLISVVFRLWQRPTLLEGEPHPKHNFSVATHDDPAISTARQLLLEERRIHPILLPFWARLERDGTLEKLQQFGYDFAELRPVR
jgi:hypothetical protein